MSRLDFHIQQKIAQRDSLTLAAKWLVGEAGVVAEFGLGSGRSYSHLREHFPDHEIFCFDRLDKSHPESRPPTSQLYLGEFAQVLADPVLHARFRDRVILLHLDIGSGGPEAAVVPEQILRSVYAWLRPGAVVLSDQELSLEAAWRLRPVDLQGEVDYAECYHAYRRQPARDDQPEEECGP